MTPPDALGVEAKDLERMRAIAAREWWERNSEDTLDGMLVALRWLPVMEALEANRRAGICYTESPRSDTERTPPPSADVDKLHALIGMHWTRDAVEEFIVSLRSDTTDHIDDTEAVNER